MIKIIKLLHVIDEAAAFWLAMMSFHTLDVMVVITSQKGVIKLT